MLYIQSILKFYVKDSDYCDCAGMFLSNVIIDILLSFKYVERLFYNISILFQLLEELNRKSWKYPSNSEWWQKLRGKIKNNEERSKVV